MIAEAFTELAPQLGIKAACQLLGKPRSATTAGCDRHRLGRVRRGRPHPTP